VTHRWWSVLLSAVTESGCCGLLVCMTFLSPIVRLQGVRITGSQMKLAGSEFHGKGGRLRMLGGACTVAVAQGRGQCGAVSRGRHLQSMSSRIGRVWSHRWLLTGYAWTLWDGLFSAGGAGATG
jgi:hypothetical protein